METVSPCQEVAEAAAKKFRELLLSLYEEQPSTNCNQLPKLTAEVFDLPHFPKTADYAVVTKDGGVTAYTHEPYVNKEIPCWGFNRGCSFTVATAGSYDSFGWQNSLIQRPAKLPDWCKVGEWVYADGKGGYGKVYEIKDYIRVKMENGRGVNQISEYKINELSRARLRPFNAEEMKALVTKVIENEDELMFVTGYDKKDNLVVVWDEYFSADSLLKKCTIDGKPCGVLEHLQDGVWVE